jgi:formamidopyrimidine-DNA glycosylase
VPELPEVERARREAQRRLRGRRIAEVATVRDPIVYAGVDPRRFAEALRGRTVSGVHRKGKHLWIELDRAPHPLFHFGMTGSFEFYRRPEERPRFWRVELRMDDGMHLAMPDARRFGRIRLAHDPEREPPLSDLGFDPLLRPPTRRRWPTCSAAGMPPSRPSSSIKPSSRGVGNWIADEILFQAGVRPHRKASSLRPEEVARLRSRLVAIVPPRGEGKRRFRSLPPELALPRALGPEQGGAHSPG